MIDQWHKVHVENAQFSLLIPTWNNLPFLKLCVKSIMGNSDFKHQIIVHINEGNDGTLDWVKENNLSYTYSTKNIGVCWSMNAMRTLVETDYMVFINDDMYVCPNWDSALFDEITSIGHNLFYLSSTLLQPRKFWCKSVIGEANFGEDVASFREKDLLLHYLDMPHTDWKGATWPPVVVHKDIWDLVGGYSIEFSPGLYSDPDFSAKLYLAGVRHFKGINKSRVYHFEAKSTGRVKRNKGSRQFLNKWGITASVFMKQILQRGEPFNDQNPVNVSIMDIFRSRVKRIASSLLSGGSNQKVWKAKPF
jgi:glycosyltransferase involved in cell wall biosynthesis